MIMIVDLDGTLLSVNSFRIWSLFMLRGRFENLDRGSRIRLATATFAALAMRKVGLISHCRFKSRLHKLWLDAAGRDNHAGNRRLIGELRGFVREEFAEVLVAIATGKIDAVLATAAAHGYAYDLGISIGFSHVLATPLDESSMEEDNSGERKRESVFGFLDTQGWLSRPRVLFTDHADDLPLIRECQMVCWLGPAEEQASIEQKAPGVDIRRGVPTLRAMELAIHGRLPAHSMRTLSGPAAPRCAS